MINAIYKLPEQSKSIDLIDIIYSVYESEDEDYFLNWFNKLFDKNLIFIEDFEKLVENNSLSNFLEKQDCIIVELIYSVVVENEGFMTIDGREEKIDYIRINNLEELTKLYEDLKYIA